MKRTLNPGNKDESQKGRKIEVEKEEIHSREHIQGSQRLWGKQMKLTCCTLFLLYEGTHLSPITEQSGNIKK